MSSEIMKVLVSLAIDTIALSSSFVNTLPVGLCGFVSRSNYTFGSEHALNKSFWSKVKILFEALSCTGHIFL